ncbi:MAG: sulfur carrier protein ThiS adenylyltransferase ThiF [Clostridia bacterium]|nr:sulfur carrier protein ThiS adenylyltransferase ThiF [Clostridia bacterium]
MKIKLNEKEIEIEKDFSIITLVNTYQPDADIWVYNGYPIKEDVILEEGDRVFLITKGMIPSEEVLEEALVSRHTPGVHEAVKKVSVAICGLGGLGSNVAIMLSRLGINHLKLIDFDVVEPSNLNRQQYFIEHIGMKKTDALKDILKHINPYVIVETVDCYIRKEDVYPLLKDVEIIVEAFDGAENKAMLVNEVLEQFPEKYLVAASGLAGYEDSNTITTKKITSKFYLIGDDVSEAKPGWGLMAPRATLAAAHQANAVLRIIMKV